MSWMRFKCLLGKHQFVWQWKIQHLQQNVWQCPVCKIWYIQDYGADCGYKTKELPVFARNKEGN